nr:MAG TPA: hypothetical protein [Caudoviricetes sp.]
MSDAPINSFNFLDELKTAVGGGGGGSIEPATTTTLGTVYLQARNGDYSNGNLTAANAYITEYRTNLLANRWYVDLQTPIIPDNITWLKVAKIPVKTKSVYYNPISCLRSGMVMFANTAIEDKTLTANTVFATNLSLSNGLTNSCMVMHANGTISENTLKTASSKSLCFTADITFPASSTTYVFIEEDN